jgi:AmiR/NasT family two-component response regulator
MTSSLSVAASTARARARDLQLRAAEALRVASETIAVSRIQLDAWTASDRSQLQREVQGLRVALASRAVIEQAKGIIMGAMNCDASTAFQVLVRQSQHENRKLHDVAESLVASKSLPISTGRAPR